MSARSRSWGLCVLGLLLALSAAAQDQGPGFVLQGEGGLITAFALDPSSSMTIYAATGRGLYKTADGGASWRRVGTGLGDHSLLAVAVDPHSPSTVFAATDTAGVFRSFDGGEHWTASNHGISAKYVGAISVHPTRDGEVYAGAEAGRIFRSVDGGSSWSELSPPTTRVAITVLAMDEKRLYAGTNSEGVYWSDDRGTTWGRPARRLSRGTVWNLTFEPVSGDLFAGTHDGLFLSTDRGATWTQANKGMRSWNVLAIAADPSSPTTLYAGTAAALYKSSDHGQTWAELKDELYVTALAVDPRTPSTLYAATHLGVLKSESAGQKWLPLRMAPRLGDAEAQIPSRSTRADGVSDDGMTATRLPALPVRSDAGPKPAAALQRPLASGPSSLPPLPVQPTPRAKP
jgi:Photosynthesis system II assembly factor YCF48